MPSGQGAVAIAMREFGEAMLELAENEWYY